MRLTSFLKFDSVLVRSVKPPDPKERVRLEWEDAQDGVSYEDVLLDLREDWGLTVISPADIDRGKMLRVREGASFYYAEVLSSARLQNGFEIELAFVDKGRRREKRSSASGTAMVKTSTAMGDAISAEVINVSASGIGLLCDRAVEANETVRIVGEGVEKLCRVRYCTKVAEGYRTGLQFCEGIEHERGE